MEAQKVDIVIAGGGPAGLSAALVLGRSRRKVAVIDDGKARNRVTKKSSGFLTRDGITPAEFKRIAKEQITNYQNVIQLDDFVAGVEKENGVFTVHTRKGMKFISKKIIFATGMKDMLPPIPGLAQTYGKSAFHCPYCDGWEFQEQPLGILGGGEHLLDYIKEIHNWSRDLVIFTHGPANIPDSHREVLKHRGIDLIETPIAKIQSENGMMSAIWLSNGRKIARKGMFIQETGQQQSSKLPLKLGVELKEAGTFDTGEHGQTAVDGLSVIGDAKNKFTGLVGAASQGYEIAVVINNELIEEEWRNN